MNHPTRFIVYKHQLVLNDNQLITRQFICLQMSSGTIFFTDFHKYVKNPNRQVCRIDENGNNRCTFVVQLLNYAFFHKRIHSLNDITVNILKEFLNSYGQCTLPDDDENTHRNEKTVRRCVNVILDFMELFLHNNNKCKMTVDDLYTYSEYRDHHGKIGTRKVPIFDVTFTGSSRPIFRDLPDVVYSIIYSHIKTHHTHLLALIALSSFAGLRPSEACNVRRHDSVLGPGVIFTEINGKVVKAEIDLRKERVLRSDFKPTGMIKKERMQKVPDIFLDAFVDSYNTYMKYMNGKKYETDYGPLTVNKQGKAYTYASYYTKFRAIITDEIIPILLADDDPQIVLYGRILLENNIAPHVFRHWYTVQLVLSGVSEPGILMKLRGDTSPESSLTYINGKSELERQFRKVNNNAFEYNYWLAGKRYAND